MIRYLTENWGYKVFALVLSAVFWLLIVDESELATGISVPLEFRNMPRGLELGSGANERIHLEIRGPVSKLRPANLAETVVIIDLGGVNRPGDHTFPIRANDVNLPPGVQLGRAVPARVRLHFERHASKTIPVNVKIGARPPDGYEVEAMHANPPAVIIAGPESRVQMIQAAETDPVDLSEVVDTLETTVQTYVPDAQIRIDSSSRVVVNVKVRLKSGKSN